jgi:hypothetical protein
VTLEVTPTVIDSAAPASSRGHLTATHWRCQFQQLEWMAGKSGAVSLILGLGARILSMLELETSTNGRISRARIFHLEPGTRFRVVPKFCLG